MCSALLEDLKSYDSILGTPTAGPSKGAPGSTSLSAMIEAAMEEIFVPWLEGTRYLESESKNLVELYAGLLSRFTRYHVSDSSPSALTRPLIVRKLCSRLSQTLCSTKSYSNLHLHPLQRRLRPPLKLLPPLSPSMPTSSPLQPRRKRLPHRLFPAMALCLPPRHQNLDYRLTSPC